MHPHAHVPKLDVYQRSIEFLAFASELVEELPRGSSERADQLIRAAESVPRNLAEGAGRWSKVDMSKHYEIARGEAMACAASLDVDDHVGVYVNGYAYTACLVGPYCKISALLSTARCCSVSSVPTFVRLSPDPASEA